MTASMRLSIKKDPMNTMAEQNSDESQKESLYAMLYIICDQLSRVMI